MAHYVIKVWRKEGRGLRKVESVDTIDAGDDYEEAKKEFKNFRPGKDIVRVKLIERSGRRSTRW